MAKSKKKHKFSHEPIPLSKEWTMDDVNLADFLREKRWKLSEEKVSEGVAILQHHNVTTMAELKNELMPGSRHQVDEDDDDEEDDQMEGGDGVEEEDLKKKLGTLLGLPVWGDFMLFVGTDIQPPKNPEDILDKKFLDQSGQPLTERESKQREFTQEAIAVKGPPTGTTNRSYDIRIVQGPSGSGKTVYAINHLASLNDDPTQSAEKGVCIYNSLSEHSSSMFKEEDSFLEAMKKVLREALLKGSDGKWDGETQLNMRVSLILDEAGALSDILDDFGLLQQVHGAIKAYSMFPRLILAGTGYDKTPKGGSSATDMYKYRMQPWNETNLSLVAKRRYPVNGDGEKFAAAIFRYPLLKRLITNARAAVFTLDAVKRLKTGHHTIKLQGSIGTVVQMVIGEYTAFNQIGKLEDSQRKMLAYAVFCELDLQNSNEEPRFPEFKKIIDSKQLLDGEKDKIIRQAQGVVDLHVEASSARGVIACDFVDEEARENKQSISVTPAMSMLLYNLLGVDATIYDNWEGLEATAALHAAYLEVLSNEDTKRDGVQIARLTKAVPATGATKNIIIPRQLTTPTIFINGDKAPFFDVITKRRGIQAKYSKKAENAPLDLGTELQKCGLLKEKLSFALMTRDGVDESPAHDEIEKDSQKAWKEEADVDQSAVHDEDGNHSLDEDEDLEEEQDTVSEEDLVDKSDGEDVGDEAENKKAKAEETKERKKKELIAKGEKAFKMGNATMAAFVHTWKGVGEVMGHSKGGNVSEVKPKKFLSPAFGFPTTGRAEKEVVPSHKYKVEEKVEKNGSAVKFPVKFQRQKIPEASFDAAAPFEMIFITNAKQMELFPKWNGKAIVIASGSVGASGEFQAGKKPDGYDEFLRQFKPKENVNIRFVFTG